MRRTLLLLPLLVCALASTASAQLANGKLQIHFMNVNQGDGALLVAATEQRTDDDIELLATTLEHAIAPGAA